MTARIGLVGWEESSLLPALFKTLRALLGEGNAVCAVRRHPRVVPDRGLLASCSHIIDVKREEESSDRLEDSILSWRAPVSDAVLVPLLHLLPAGSPNGGEMPFAGWRDLPEFHEFRCQPFSLCDVFEWIGKSGSRAMDQADWHKFLEGNSGDDAWFLLARLFMAMDDIMSEKGISTLKRIASIGNDIRRKGRGDAGGVPHSMKYLVPRLRSEVEEFLTKGDPSGVGDFVDGALFKWAHGAIGEYLGDLAAYGRI